MSQQNKIELSAAQFYIGNANHIFADITIKQQKVTFLVDTGFTLGFGFALRRLPDFNFKNGFLNNLVLGDGSMSNGYAFQTDVFLDNNSLGKCSTVFVTGSDEPIVGIEFLRL